MTTVMDSTLARPLRTAGLFVLIVLTLWMALLWWNWGAIDRVNLEAGDFAANSLQVLQAKSGLLLDGHYSRFGFLHPGPALLYTLAGGEVILANGFGFLPSAFSGQLAAAAFLAAVSVTTVAFMVRALTGRWLVATSATALFIAVIAWLDTQAFTSPWMPYLVVLPFVAFLASTALAAAGRASALPAVAIFAGLLIHGHASFVFITFVILATAVVYNTFTQPRDSNERILGASFWSNHKVAAAGTGVIGAAFLAPLGVRTAQDWPGPIHEYLTVSDSGTGRGISGSLEALTANPRGTWVFAATTVILIALAFLSRRQPVATGAMPLIVILLAATTAHVVYVLVSVDDPANTHLLLYFFAVPALVSSAILLSLAGRVDGKAIWTVIASVSVAVALITLVAYRPTVWPRDYQRTEIIAVDQQIPLSNSPIIVDLDNTGNWGDVWSGAIGWVLLRQREEPDSRVCIRDNWFIGFTEDLRCTPTDLEAGRAFRISDDDGTLRVTPTAS